MPALTAMFASSVSRRDQAVKKTCEGFSGPSTVVNDAAEVRSAGNHRTPARSAPGLRDRARTAHPSRAKLSTRADPAMPVAPTTRAVRCVPADVPVLADVPVSMVNGAPLDFCCAVPSMPPAAHWRQATPPGRYSCPASTARPRRRLSPPVPVANNREASRAPCGWSSRNWIRAQAPASQPAPSRRRPLLRAAARVR